MLFLSRQLELVVVARVTLEMMENCVRPRATKLSELATRGTVSGAVNWDLRREPENH